jgi:hypothetical protein
MPGGGGKEALEMPRADSGASDRRMRREVPCVRARGRELVRAKRGLSGRRKRKATRSGTNSGREDVCVCV